MKTTKGLIYKCFVIISAILLLAGNVSSGQEVRVNLSLSPVITWFGSDKGEITNKGARPGFDFTIKAERYFTDNFAYTGGLGFLTSSGRLESSLATDFLLPDRTVTVEPGKPIVYKINYLAIPVGLKFRTNEKNLLSFYGELGLDPEVVVSARVDIPSLDLKNEKGAKELNRFNIGYHLNGGAGYSVGDNLMLTFGLGFENNFLDVTRERLSQPGDHIGQRFIKFIFGINFLAYE
jgi:hypothetical protein